VRGNSNFGRSRINRECTRFQPSWAPIGHRFFVVESPVKSRATYAERYTARAVYFLELR